MFKLYKRKDSWYVAINIDGQRVRRSAGTSEKTLAEEFAANLHNEIYRQIKIGDRPRWTWKNAVLRYLNEQNGARKTRSTLSLIRNLSPHFSNGDMVLADINGRFIENILKAVGHNRTVATRNRYGQLIRAILRAAAYRWEDDKGRHWIDKPPYIEILPENNARDRWLTRDEVRDLVINLPTHLAEMVCIALFTGLRESNITQMQWRWVDLDRRIVVIPREHSKTKKPIPVYLVAEAYNVIEGRKGVDPDYVFTFRKRRITRINNTGWKMARDAAGLKGIRVHDLRRTWASWHLQAGTTIDELMRIGGWASPEIVRERYAHLAPEQLREIAENIKPSARATY